MSSVNVISEIKNASKIINYHYDASFDKIKTIAHNSTGNIDAVSKGFCYGYQQGVKATKAEMRKGGAANG